MATSESSKPEPKAASTDSAKSTAPTGTQKPATRATVRRPDDVEPTPVIGGRFLGAAAILGLIVLIPASPLGNLFEPSDPPGTDTSAWQPGQKSKLILTLVTADANALTCASPQSFEGKHCAFKTESDPWPRDPQTPMDDNKASLIQPYRTWLDNKLVLVAGVWAQPSLAMRVHREPPGNLSPDKLARFTAECQVHFAAKMDKPALRWAPGQSWGTEQPTMVAIADECHVIDEPSRDCPEGPICALMKAFH
ncbi:MAG TPA: hypothetical protein VK745_02215 [Polyangiaceae bacterium]|jgi:hypothetical protein|nr:hypothetical protein [Polyangiaceae bacterium]